MGVVRRHWPAAVAATVFVVAVVLGVRSGTSAGLLVVGLVAVLAVMAHFWFVEWGPHAEPNRLYRRFLGKSTLFRIPPLNPLLRLAGVVPVYRAQDGAGTERNDRTFSRCRQLLARGAWWRSSRRGSATTSPCCSPCAQARPASPS